MAKASNNRDDFAGHVQQDAPQFLQAITNLMEEQLDTMSKLQLQTLMESPLLWESSCPTVGNMCGTTVHIEKEKNTHTSSG